MAEGLSGVLNIRKPVGPTSHDVVARVRRLLRTRRIGHAGTLDPAAEGVLVLFLGTATRLIEYTADADKEYVADCLFGIATTTLDATGEVTATADASALHRAALEAVLPRFTGPILQVPPMYSAVHHEGKRLYELARRGEEVERAPREVVIHALELLAFTPGATARARLRVVCSKGTYIRTLAADIGAALELPAHLAALTRTRVGPFRIEDAVTLEALAAAAEWESDPAASPLRRLLLPASAAVAHLPGVVITGADLARVRHGNAVTVPAPGDESASPVRIESPEGELIGIGRRERTATGWCLQPQKVL
ncbi:MAG: tRNA pseudouridine(55) synthase TruB [Armatimonadetes bacterium]|nr:tRNA pseudouridine(55) synthase TruB [Armatimonadota bacterium]